MVSYMLTIDTVIDVSSACCDRHLIQHLYSGVHFLYSVGYESELLEA